jgi:hypothetical protein
VTGQFANCPKGASRRKNRTAESHDRGIGNLRAPYSSQTKQFCYELQCYHGLCGVPLWEAKVGRTSLLRTVEQVADAWDFRSRRIDAPTAIGGAIVGHGVFLIEAAGVAAPAPKKPRSTLLPKTQRYQEKAGRNRVRGVELTCQTYNRSVLRKGSGPSQRGTAGAVGSGVVHAHDTS